MNTTEKLMSNADRAFELLEQKSPHQLAVELAELQQKHDIALAALNKMQDQRDQLAAQLKDATAQCGLMAELLTEAWGYINSSAEREENSTVAEDDRKLLERVDAALAGKLPEPFIIARGKLPELTAEEANRLLRPGPIIRANKPAVPEGWQLVPVKPTQEMVTSGGLFMNHRFSIWEEMLAAAPKPEGGER